MPVKKSEWDVKSGRDSQIATDEGQVGGVRVEDSAKVKGDAVGGDKHETHYHHYSRPPADKPHSLYSLGWHTR